MDGETLITGSSNFTEAAEEKNAENLLVIRDRRLAGIYTRNWLAPERHSEDYQVRSKWEDVGSIQEAVYRMHEMSRQESP